MVALLRQMRQAGVPIVAATDGSGIEIVRELEIYVQAVSVQPGRSRRRRGARPRPAGGRDDLRPRPDSGMTTEPAPGTARAPAPAPCFAFVGPSGAGKDSVMAAVARARPDVLLACRVVTRPPDPTEPFEAATRDSFDRDRASGRFVLDWDAHGLSYGIPREVRGAQAAGRILFVNLSRAVLPQAVRRVVPPLLNDLVSLQKDSGLIAVLGVIDAIRAAQIETATDFNFTPYVVAGLLFVALTIPLARLTDWVARRQGWLGATGAAR